MSEGNDLRPLLMVAGVALEVAQGQLQRAIRKERRGCAFEETTPRMMEWEDALRIVDDALKTLEPFLPPMKRKPH